MKKIVTENDLSELFWFPDTPYVLVRYWNRTTEKVNTTWWYRFSRYKIQRLIAIAPLRYFAPDRYGYDLFLVTVQYSRSLSNLDVSFNL